MDQKFILRIDDVGQDLDQTQPDKGLRYFMDWFTKGGWQGLPVYLGVVPSFLDMEAILTLRDLQQEGAIISLHGWNHEKQPLTPDHIRRAVEIFPAADSVIPPYNMYDVATVTGMDLHMPPGAKCLFGGMVNDHHQHGTKPKWVSADVLHLNAACKLYARSWDAANAVNSIFKGAEPGANHPLVITLHHRWEHQAVGASAGLREMIHNCLVPWRHAMPRPRPRSTAI